MRTLTQALLFGTLTTNASAEETRPTQLKPEALQAALPPATEDNAAIRAALTLAATRVAALGFENMSIQSDDDLNSIRFAGLPSGEWGVASEAINNTSVSPVNCISFVVIPETELSPDEYTGPWTVGATCGTDVLTYSSSSQ